MNKIILFTALSISGLSLSSGCESDRLKLGLAKAGADKLVGNMPQTYREVTPDKWPLALFIQDDVGKNFKIVIREREQVFARAEETAMKAREVTVAPKTPMKTDAVTVVPQQPADLDQHHKQP